MDRLISEQAVIDAICKVCAVEVKPSECRYRKGLFGGCKEYEAIKAIPSELNNVLEEIDKDYIMVKRSIFEDMQKALNSISVRGE